MPAIKITVRQKRVVYDTTISITSFDGEVRDIVDEDSNPESLLIRKVEGLANLLGVSEQEAERLLFARCDAF
jgi:hypothetical protein